MAEVTSLRKSRQKNLKTLSDTIKHEEGKQVSTYLYPKSNLYTRQEFELLDTIYSDESPGSMSEIKEDGFWSGSDDELLLFKTKKNKWFSNAIWFVSGMTLTSVLWFTFFQIKVHEIRTKDNTKIVFHKTDIVVTDKTADQKLTKSLENKTQSKNVKVAQNNTPWFSWLNQSQKSKNEKVVATQLTNQSTQQVKHYTVTSGDSLWLIANKCYSSPTPDNINKIAQANNLRLTSALQPGQKLTIPL